MKIKDENQIEKVLGDIGYSFEGMTNKEKELQFQTNRIGKDFDKLLHEMKQFQKAIKSKLNVQHSDEKNKMNILKDIFLLDNKANIKNAVDRAIYNIKEPFDAEAYKKKVDKEKLEEIKNLIDKKIEDYNDNVSKMGYGGQIYEEKRQMIHGNIINKYEYQKYRQKVNNKITTLPNIFIKASKMIISNRNKKNGASKKSNISSTQSTESNIHIFKKLKEETIHFGDTVKEDSEFMSNDQISQLPKINPEEAKKDNVEVKSENWFSDDKGKNIVKNEESKTKNKTNSKKSETNKKSEKKEETNKTQGKNEEQEEKDENEENEEEKEEDEENEDEEEKEEDEDEENEEDEEKEEDEDEENEDEEKNEDNDEEENEENEEDNSEKDIKKESKKSKNKHKKKENDNNDDEEENEEND